MTDVIDLRSDTVTRPTPPMWEAMRAAELGDDVLGDEPTVNRLQERVAAELGKESACYFPSGTMANQAAIRAQTQPGDEVICHPSAHIYHYEFGAPAALSGVSLRFADGERGMYSPDALSACVRPANHHFAPARLVVIENTSNGGGGSVWPIDLVRNVTDRARSHDLRIHLDGARLWNAAVASGNSPRAYAAHFDTVSVCFSKGLGAPVGSAVAGDGETMRRVFRFRKMFGGAMRQSGMLAGACLHALDHHVDRLAEDHTHAKRLARSLAECPALSVDPASVETNIAFVGVDPAWGDARELVNALASRGVLVIASASHQIRVVTHLDVSSSKVDEAIRAFRETMERGPEASARASTAGNCLVRPPADG
ncbi:MAG: threonine aldolase family protein [Phycisphaerales bacterium JB059]